MSKLLSEYNIEEDPRNKQCFIEAMAALILYFVYMVVVFGTVYGLWYLGDQTSTVFGLPAYLFWGVLVPTIALIFAIWIMVKFIYRDLSLDAVAPADDRNTPESTP